MLYKILTINEWTHHERMTHKVIITLFLSAFYPMTNLDRRVDVLTIRHWNTKYVPMYIEWKLKVIVMGMCHKVIAYNDLNNHILDKDTYGVLWYFRGAYVYICLVKIPA